MTQFLHNFIFRKDVEDVNRKMLLLGDSLKMSTSKFMAIRIMFCLLVFFACVYFSQG